MDVDKERKLYIDGKIRLKGALKTRLDFYFLTLYLFLIKKQRHTSISLF